MKAAQAGAVTIRAGASGFLLSRMGVRGEWLTTTSTQLPPSALL